MLAVIMFVSPAGAVMPEKDLVRVVDSLNVELSHAKNGPDSIRTLSNLFDIALTDNSVVADSLAKLIYDYSMRHGDKKMALEMLCHRSNLNLRNLTTLERLLATARQIEASDSTMSKETSTFLRMTLNNCYNTLSTEELRRSRFEKELESWHMNPPSDLYDQIVLLHSVVLSLSQVTSGDILLNYINELEQLIDKLPPAQYLIRNNFYALMGPTLYNSGYPDEGFKADMKLSNVLDSLEVHYIANGRPFKRYNRYRFNIYLRALSNYPNLSPEKIEDYYNKARRYRDLSAVIRRQQSNYDLLEIYYALAHKNYAKAHPLIKEMLLDESVKPRQRLSLLTMAAETSEHTGDSEFQLQVLKELQTALEDRIKTTTHQKVRELQILYEVNDMNRNIADLEYTRVESENNRRRQIILLSMIAILLLLGAVVIISRLYRRSKRMSRSLKEANTALTAESQRLLLTQGKLTRARDEARQANQLKSDFMRNLGKELSQPLEAVEEYTRLIIDCTDTQGKAYLNDYAELVARNCEFLSVVMNDIFKLSEEKNADGLLIHPELTDLTQAINLAIDTARAGAQTGVEIKLAPDCPDLSIMIDPNRLQQIMLQLLRNATKTTTAGSITVAYGLVNDGSKVAVSVTDTGEVMDRNKAENMIERHSLGKKNGKDRSFGMPIARLVAHLLGGEIILDPTYHGGARYVVTFPYTFTKK